MASTRNDENSACQEDAAIEESAVIHQSQQTEKDKENPRSVLKHLWSSIKVKTTTAKVKLGEISTDMSTLSDAADLGMLAADFGNEHGDWELGIESALRLNNALDDYERKITLLGEEFRPISDTSGGSAITGSFSLVDPGLFARNATPDGHSVFIMPPSQPFLHSAENVWQGYVDFLGRADLKNRVLILMKDCGFHERTYGKQAIERFTNAWSIYEQHPPVDDPAMGSLISIRQAIKLTIDTLSQLKLKQTNNKQRVKDIGDQLANPGISPDIYDELQSTYEKLNDDLSYVKDHISDRSLETTMMMKGTLFLQTLLSSIDLEKANKIEKSSEDGV